MALKRGIYVTIATLGLVACLVNCKPTAKTPRTYRPVCSKGLAVGDSCQPISTLKQGCDGPECESYGLVRAKAWETYRRVARPNAASEKAISKRIVDAAIAVNRHIAKYGPPRKKAICRRRYTGDFVCLETQKVLASYDATVSVALLSDLRRIETLVPKLGDEDNVLLACGDSDNSWVDLKVSFTGIRDLRWKLASKSHLIAKLCEETGLGKASGGSNGLSGLTGIGAPATDAMPCGSDLLGTSPFEAIKDMVAVAESFRECGAGGSGEGTSPPPSTTLMDGGNGGGSSPPAPAPKILTDSEGNVTGVEYTDPDTGEVVTIEFTSEGPAVTSAPDPNTIIRTNPDGSTTVERTVADGFVDTHYVGADGEYQGYTKTRTVVSGDITVVSRQHFGPDGSHIGSDKLESNGRGQYLFENDKVFIDGTGPIIDIWEKGPDGRLYKPIRIDDADCIDPETCGRCEAAQEAFREAFGECLSLGSQSPACNSYRNSSSCCDGQGSAGDPTLLIPNPMGDLVCHQGDLNSSQETCDQRCKVASEPNCLQDCLDLRNRPQFEWSLLDRACIYMYSEDCFSQTTTSGDQRPLMPSSDPLAQHSLFPASPICTGIGCSR